MKSEIEHQNALSSVNRRFEKSGKEHCLRTQKITSELTSVATIARAGSSSPAEIASCAGGAPLISIFLFAQQYFDGSGCHGIRNRFSMVIILHVRIFGKKYSFTGIAILYDDYSYQCVSH